MKNAFMLLIFCTLTFTFGQPAPDFTIYNYDTQQEWTLSDYLGDYVICMVSGSFC